jgi:hypothetical protein
MIGTRSHFAGLLMGLFMGMMIIPATPAEAQTGDRSGGWGARRVMVGQNRSQSSEGQAETGQPAPQETIGVGFLDVLDREREARRKALAGTWRIHIAQSDSGLPPFNALHTFNADGLFTETSDLLATATEGPAHGVWTGEKPEFSLTFELFTFNPDRTPAGIIRVRNSIRLSQDDQQLTARYAVDFIAPDGTVEATIDTGTYSGTRIRGLPVQ